MKDLLVPIIGIVFLAAIIAFVVVILVKKSKDKKTANEFLEGLSDDIINNSLIPLIATFDISLYDSLQEFESAVLTSIYNVSWNYVQNKVAEIQAEDQDVYTKAIYTLLCNKKFVDSFISNIIDNFIIKEIEDKYNNEINMADEENKIESIENEDKELADKFSDQTQYIESSEDDDIAKYVDDDIDNVIEPINKEINPQVDEEEELKPEDESIEVLDDDIYFDKAGKARSKKTGKWVKLSK